MKTGLVFSGGGGRGAYEVGVWKALNELNIKCDIVTGVSIGSINAALYAQGDLNLAISLWNDINFSTVFDLDDIPKNNKDLRKVYRKSIKSKGLEPINLYKNLKEYLNVDNIYNSDIKYGLITVEYPKLKEVELIKEDINKEEFIDYLIASSTVYPFFRVKNIDNVKYIDGGFREAIPIDLAKKLGADKLIIVNISVLKRRYAPKVDDNIIYIKSHNKLGGFLKFDGELSKRNIIYGYNDTFKAFNLYYGKKYTFKNINYVKNNIFNTYDKYINTIEYLAKSFDLEDYKIYTIKEFNDILSNKINKIDSNNINFMDLNNSKDRILYIYDRLINKKVFRYDRKKRVINIEYRCAYYLLNNIKTI